MLLLRKTGQYYAKSDVLEPDIWRVSAAIRCTDACMAICELPTTGHTSHVVSSHFIFPAITCGIRILESRMTRSPVRWQMQLAPRRYGFEQIMRLRDFKHRIQHPVEKVISTTTDCLRRESRLGTINV